MGKEARLTIGVDLGGTKIDIGLVDTAGSILQHKRIKTDVKSGPDAIEKQILRDIHEMSNLNLGTLQGIGIGVAGQIDGENGAVLFAPNLNWHNYPLQQNIQQALGLPVKVVNDLRAIAWAEKLYGAAKGCDDFVCIFVGTGVGGAIIKNGQMQKGCSNTCGELGHMTINFHGPICTCGNRGCLEAYAGGWAIAKQAQEWMRAKKAPHQILLQLANNDISKVTAKMVVEAYHQGDALARDVIEQFKQALTAGCVSIVNTLNPCRLILGGGVLAGFPDFIPSIDASIRAMALKSATKKLDVLCSNLDQNKVGVLGAASMIQTDL